MEAIQLLTSDQSKLRAHRFVPQTPNEHTVLINGGMAIPQTYYHKFAHFLAENGYTVYTYDYRGIGKGLKDAPQASTRDWAILDQTAMLEYVQNQHPKTSLVLIGHSLGGQIIGMSPAATKIDYAIVINSQSGYWRLWKKNWLKFYLNWHLVLPVLSRLYGYLPAFAMGEQVPKQVILEWCDWCKSPNYLFDFLNEEEQKRYQNLRFPMLAIYTKDDIYAPLPAVEALLSHYPSVSLSQRQISPEDIPVKQIGHFGFFRKKFRDSLWPITLSWLEKARSAKQINS